MPQMDPIADEESFVDPTADEESFVEDGNSGNGRSWAFVPY